MSSLRSLLFHRSRPSQATVTPAFRAPDERPPIATLVADLGLQPAERPMREHPHWRPPRKVLVTAGTPPLLQWLAPVAPGVALVPFELEADGLREVVDADAVIGWFSPAMVDAGERLAWLQLHVAGVENALRAPAIAARGIVVTNLKRVAGPVIAEHVFAMLLSLARSLRLLYDDQRQRRWTQFDHDASSFRQLRGRTIVVVGLGGIGSAVARLAQAFGMRVLAVRASDTDRPPFVDAVLPIDRLDDALAEADIVVDALPATPRTSGLFDARRFGAMRAGAVFVNVARGSSVVTDDLVAALRDGHVAAAALDVTDPEPLPPSHPLWTLPNVLITPHVASMSDDAGQTGWRVMRENLRRFVAGEPLLSVVDPARGY